MEPRLASFLSARLALSPLLSAAPLILSTTGAAAQAVIVVPTDQPTIQAGLLAAQHGDTVLVEPGIYHERIDFGDKQVTLVARRGARATTIDGGGGGSVVHFAWNEGAVLDGFRIVGGKAQEGGGIHSFYSSPRIVRCIVQGNKAELGAGLCFQGASPRVESCLVTENEIILQGSGAGLFAGWATELMTITGSTFVDNYGVDLFAGVAGIQCTEGAVLTDTIVRGNTSGGITSTFSIGTPRVVEHCNFEDAAFYGGTNIDADPLFVDPDQGDWHLRQGSPCIDAGGGSGGGGLDFEGGARGAGALADIGADEFEPRFYHRQSSAAGTADLVLVGLPAGTLFAAWLSTGAFETPVPSAFGDLWLSAHPFPVLAGVVAGDGLLEQTYAVPPLSSPLVLFAQGFDASLSKTSNLETLTLE